MSFPPWLAEDASRASEAIVQVVRANGEFIALKGVETLRPVLAKMLASKHLPKEQVERIMALGEAVMRAEAHPLSGGDVQPR